MTRNQQLSDEVRGERLRAIEAIAEEIRWTRLNEVWKAIWKRREQFTQVILNHCKPKQSVNPICESQKLEDVKMAHVLNVLAQCQGDKNKAAKVLGISRGNVYDYLSRLGTVAALILCLCVSVVNGFAQRGVGTTLSPIASSPSPAATMFAPALTVIQPPVNKTNLFYNIGLVWDAVPSALTTGYRIRYGTNTSSAFTNVVDVSRVLTNAATQSCTVSNLAFKPTWYFQAFTLWGTNVSEGSHIVQVQPPLEAGLVLSAVFPLYSSSNFVNWVTNKIVQLVLTNPPASTFFRSHLRQIDYQWTNNQIALRPFPKL